MNHVREPFQSLLNDIRDGTAALERAAALGKLKDGKRMSEPAKTPAVKIVIEKSPWPRAEPQYLWTAYYEGQEDELSEAGATPEEALGRFLNAVANADEGEGQ